jgi:hypothetical protein
MRQCAFTHNVRQRKVPPVVGSAICRVHDRDKLAALMSGDPDSFASS